MPGIGRQRPRGATDMHSASGTTASAGVVSWFRRNSLRLKPFGRPTWTLAQGMILALVIAWAASSVPHFNSSRLIAFQAAVEPATCSWMADEPLPQLSESRSVSAVAGGLRQRRFRGGRRRDRGGTQAADVDSGPECVVQQCDRRSGSRRGDPARREPVRHPRVRPALQHAFVGGEDPTQAEDWRSEDALPVRKRHLR